MIEFIPAASKSQPLVFRNVKINQFFVDDDGFLCQKVDDDSYNCIADKTSNPYAQHCQRVHEDDLVKQILPPILKIKF